MNEHERTERSAVRRLPERGRYERDEVAAILAEGLVCHVGIASGEQPFVLPMVYGFDGDALYLHGSPASRLLRALCAGEPACVTVTHLDGLVLARSAFHHSLNYRSVVLLGRGRELTEPEEKRRALELLVEHVVPGRARDARAASEKELRATAVVRLDLREVSAKVRSGPPVDDDDDHALDVWAGIVPLRLEAGQPEADPLLRAGIPVPGYLRDYRRG